MPIYVYERGMQGPEGPQGPQGASGPAGVGDGAILRRVMASTLNEGVGTGADFLEGLGATIAGFASQTVTAEGIVTVITPDEQHQMVCYVADVPLTIPEAASGDYIYGVRVTKLSAENGWVDDNSDPLGSIGWSAFVVQPDTQLRDGYHVQQSGNLWSASDEGMAMGQPGKAVVNGPFLTGISGGPDAFDVRLDVPYEVTDADLTVTLIVNGGVHFPDSSTGIASLSVKIEALVMSGYPGAWPMTEDVGMAGRIGYDNVTSGLAAEDVRAAIDELAASVSGSGSSRVVDFIEVAGDSGSYSVTGEPRDVVVMFTSPYDYRDGAFALELPAPTESDLGKYWSVSFYSIVEGAIYLEQDDWPASTIVAGYPPLAIEVPWLRTTKFACIDGASLGGEGFYWYPLARHDNYFGKLEDEYYAIFKAYSKYRGIASAYDAIQGSPVDDGGNLVWVYTDPFDPLVTGHWEWTTAGGGASLSDTDPADLGITSAGASTEASRSDHVHDMPLIHDLDGITDLGSRPGEGDYPTAGQAIITAGDGTYIYGTPNLAMTDLTDFVDPLIFSAGDVVSWNGASFTLATPTGVTDHGDLAGLTDDDHHQYQTVGETSWPSPSGDIYSVSGLPRAVAMSYTGSGTPTFVISEAASGPAQAGRAWSVGYFSTDDTISLGLVNGFGPNVPLPSGWTGVIKSTYVPDPGIPGGGWVWAVEGMYPQNQSRLENWLIQNGYLESNGSNSAVLIWNGVDDYTPAALKASDLPKEFRGPTDPSTVDGVVLNTYDRWVQI